MTTKLDPILSTLDASKIGRMNIDLDGSTLSLNLLPEQQSDVDVRFEGVSAFYYIDGSDEKQSEPKSQVHSITYHQRGFGEFAAVRYLDDPADDGDFHVSIPNFAISLDESSIFIEAESVRIDDQVFTVRNRK